MIPVWSHSDNCGFLQCSKFAGEFDLNEGVGYWGTRDFTPVPCVLQNIAGVVKQATWPKLRTHRVHPRNPERRVSLCLAPIELGIGRGRRVFELRDNNLG